MVSAVAVWGGGERVEQGVCVLGKGASWCKRRRTGSLPSMHGKSYCTGLGLLCGPVCAPVCASLTAQRPLRGG